MALNFRDHWTLPERDKSLPVSNMRCYITHTNYTSCCWISCVDHTMYISCKLDYLTSYRAIFLLSVDGAMTMTEYWHVGRDSYQT